MNQSYFLSFYGLKNVRSRLQYILHGCSRETDVSTDLLRHVLECKILLVMVNDRVAEAMCIIQNTVASAYYLQLLLSWYLMG